jgi:Domain of unknown function (DUF4136)
MFRRVVLLLLVSFLAACANPVLRSDVLSFHQWPTNNAERAFQLKRLAAQENSLEHATYEGQLRAELQAAGFKESANARFVVTMEYAQEARTVRLYDAPVMVSPSVYWSSGFYRSGWGMSVGVPFGLPPYAVSRDYPTYVRTLKLFMNDQSAPGAPRVWEGTANSSGSTQDFVAIAPFMLRALLADFPGQSGSSRRVDVELPKEN